MALTVNRLPKQENRRPDQGFSLIELMMALGIMLVVGGAVMMLMFKMTMSQSRISARSGMHSAVRSATALLQQEVSQAGRLAFPVPVTVAAPIPANPGVPQVVTVQTAGGTSGTISMFVGIILAVDAGPNREIVTATVVTANSFTAIFDLAHPIGAVVEPQGGFPTGIMAPAQDAINVGGLPINVNGNESGDFVLKLYGDLNDDGNILYVEYVCDTAAGFLYRNAMPFNQAPPSAAPNVTQILLENLIPNPDGPDAGTLPDPCFSYREIRVGGNVYVTNVAITLTVNPEYRDFETGRLDPETKALLNVSPRNIYEMWQLASLNPVAGYVQPTPPSIVLLLP